MKKLILVLIVIAIVATACGGGGDRDGSGEHPCPDLTCLLARQIDSRGNGNGGVDLVEILSPVPGPPGGE